MKLKEFNAENTISVRGSRSGIPSISINQKTGLVSFNKKACDLIGIDDAGQITFLNDEDDTDCWYVEKVAGKGFSLRGKKDANSGLMFNNTTIVREICKSVEFTGNSGRLLIAGTPTMHGKGRKIWGLLTAKLVNV